jgi:hypothetical protein
MSMPPGFNGPMGTGRGHPFPGSGPPPPGFGFPQPMDVPMPGGGHPFGPVLPKEPAGPSHSRQPSSSFEPSTPASAHPISRPAPIGRPSSIVHGQRHPSGPSPVSMLNVDSEDHHLGSSALLDDSDEPFQDLPSSRRNTAAPGPRPAPGFPFGMDTMFGSPHNPWAPPNAFGGPTPPPPGLGAHPIATPWGMGMSPPGPAFGGPPGLGRSSEPRSVAVRKMLCRACEDLSKDYMDYIGAKNNDRRTPDGASGYIPLEAVKEKVEQLSQSLGAVPEKELLEYCDTEGNDGNGGGSFDVREDAPGRKSIRFVPDSGLSGPQPFMQRAVGAPGNMGSPIIGGPSPLTTGPASLASSFR